jgi:rhodanese-related sulfurtransferase
MPQFNQITPAQLFRLIGTPDAPVVLDVRSDDDFRADPQVIPTSRRLAHDRIGDHIPGLGGRPCVVVCKRGLKLSEGVAAELRAAGVTAEVLAGGTLGWAAAGLPMTTADLLQGSALWVTRHRPKIDRIACPWLIRRFVNPDARFLFVAPSEVQAVADIFGATPFDIEGAFWSHRGEGCSFDTMIAEFGLSHPALERLATVVRAADTNRPDLAPQAAGLLAISVGLSRLHKDDNSQMEAGIAFYDALFRWARDGFEEGHDWPAVR